MAAWPRPPRPSWIVLSIKATTTEACISSSPDSQHFHISFFRKASVQDAFFVLFRRSLASSTEDGRARRISDFAFDEALKLLTQWQCGGVRLSALLPESIIDQI